MALHVSVDFGTSSTCTVFSVDGRPPQVVDIDGRQLIPSAVFAAADGTVFVGQEAERQAALDPSRFEPHPKRRIDEGELLLGRTILPVTDVVRVVLRRAVAQARRRAGGARVDLLVLTHPADWGSVRTEVLRKAAIGMAVELVLVPEPVAAAVFHSTQQGLRDGQALAVLDLGGGTVDASVLRKEGNSFRVLATRGDPSFGGADIDQTLLEYVGRLSSSTDERAWRRLIEGRELPDRRRRRVVGQDVRGGKETLSRHAFTDIPLPRPFPPAHVTRADLERLVSVPLAKAVDLVLTALRDAHVEIRDLGGVFLVGGSSRIPLVSRLIHERTGIVPTTLDQPETVVARGALRAARLIPDGPGRSVLADSADVARNSSAPTIRRYPGLLAAQAPGQPSEALSQATTVVLGRNEPTTPILRRSQGQRWAAPWLIATVVGILVVLGVVLMVMLAGGRDQAVAGAPHAARNDYSFDYPAEWKQTGGDPHLW